jgi:hypothetical protein
LKEFNLDEHDKGIIDEEMDKKYSIWSDVVKGKKKARKRRETVRYQQMK